MKHHAVLLALRGRALSDWTAARSRLFRRARFSAAQARG